MIACLMLSCVLWALSCLNINPFFNLDFGIFVVFMSLISAPKNAALYLFGRTGFFLLARVASMNLTSPSSPRCLVRLTANEYRRHWLARPVTMVTPLLAEGPLRLRPGIPCLHLLPSNTSIAVCAPNLQPGDGAPAVGGGMRGWAKCAPTTKKGNRSVRWMTCEMSKMGQ